MLIMMIRIMHHQMQVMDLKRLANNLLFIYFIL
jgi:hypothetical protein